MMLRHIWTVFVCLILILPVTPVAAQQEAFPCNSRGFATESPWINLVMNLALWVARANSNCAPSDSADTPVAEAKCVMRVTIEQQNLPMHVYPATPTDDSISVPAGTELCIVGRGTGGLDVEVLHDSWLYWVNRDDIGLERADMANLPLTGMNVTLQDGVEAAVYDQNDVPAFNTVSGTLFVRAAEMRDGRWVLYTIRQRGTGEREFLYFDASHVAEMPFDFVTQTNVVIEHIPLFEVLLDLVGSIER